MSVDRQLWSSPLTRQSAPAWPCATCGRGTLLLDQETVVEEQTTATKSARAGEYWEPEMYLGRFVAVLRCSDRKCREAVMVGGETVVEVDWNEDHSGPDLTELFWPRYINPSPKLITVPKGTPSPVATNLDTAFSVVWSDPAAAGNRIRVAVERLMDSLRLPSRKLNNRKKYDRLTLHARIELFKQKRPDLGDQLLAVKWLGNAGSHSELTRDDVFDALDIVSHVLDELYVQRTRHVVQLTKQINRRKGPRRAGR
jgi:hypothetical protein